MKYTKRILILLLCLCFLASCAEAGGESSIVSSRAEHSSVLSLEDASSIAEDESSIVEDSSVVSDNSSADESVAVSDMPDESIGEPTSCDPPPPQPVRFVDVDVAISFISNLDYSAHPDYSDYWNSWKTTYEEMASIFKEDGYLTVASHANALLTEGNVTLYPEVKFEDSGVHYFFKYQEMNVQVLIYNTKSGTDLLEDDSVETLLKYYDQRLGSHPKTYSTVEIHQPSASCALVTTAGTSIRARFVLDETHYVDIRTTLTDGVDAEWLATFIDGLTFTEVELP